MSSTQPPACCDSTQHEPINVARLTCRQLRMQPTDTAAIRSHSTVSTRTTPCTSRSCSCMSTGQAGRRKPHSEMLAAAAKAAGRQAARHTMTTTLVVDSLGMRFRYVKSITSSPLLSRMAASTQRGTVEAYFPSPAGPALSAAAQECASSVHGRATSPRTMLVSTTECVMPDRGVRPPDLQRTSLRRTLLRGSQPEQHVPTSCPDSLCSAPAAEWQGSWAAGGSTSSQGSSLRAWARKKSQEHSRLTGCSLWSALWRLRQHSPHTGLRRRCPRPASSHLSAQLYAPGSAATCFRAAVTLCLHQARADFRRTVAAAGAGGEHLPQKLPIAVVEGARLVVGHQGRQQAVDGPKCSQHDSTACHVRQHAGWRHRQGEVWQAERNSSEPGHVCKHTHVEIEVFQALHASLKAALVVLVQTTTQPAAVAGLSSRTQLLQQVLPWRAQQAAPRPRSKEAVVPSSRASTEPGTHLVMRLGVSRHSAKLACPKPTVCRLACASAAGYACRAACSRVNRLGTRLTQQRAFAS